jgi:ABC-2 type transport system ATP-binding protein
VRAKGKTILLTTHYMEEAERLCDRVAILDHGRIVAMNTPTELIHSLGGGERLTFTVESAVPPGFIDAITPIGRLEMTGKRVTITSHPDQSSFAGDTISLLTQLGIQFHDLQSEQSSLEDVFLKLTGHEMKD